MIRILMAGLILTFAFGVRALCQNDDYNYSEPEDDMADTAANNNGEWLEYPLYEDDSLLNWNSLSPVEQARILIGQAYYDSASQVLRNYVNDNGKDNEAWYLLGFAYDQKDNLPLAIEYYHKSIDLDSTYFEPSRDLAYLFDVFAQYDSMNFYMRKAVAFSPNPESLYYDFAYSFDMLNNDDSALVYYHKALIGDPGDTDSWLNIGAIWGRKDVIDSARTYTLKTLELDPYNSQACYNYAEILRQDRDYPKAIDNYQKALMLDASMVAVKLRLGDLYESLGDSTMARLYYQEFVDSSRPDYLDDINRIKAKLEKYR
jgi:tetratricopeptide (TPR) repeat protein